MNRAGTPTCMGPSSRHRTTQARTLACYYGIRMGFSTACGHGAIALGHWDVVIGIVKRDAPGCDSLDVVIDVP